MSGRPGVGEKRFSANKFYPLPDDLGQGDNMTNPNDATIEIPLTSVPSRGMGTRKLNTITSPSSYHPPTQEEDDEKNGLFSRRPGPGRRKTTGTAGGNVAEGDGALNRMGRIYRAIMHFSVITRYFIYVSPLALIIAIPIIIGATVAQDTMIGGVRIVWFFTWIEVIWLSLWVSKILAHFLPFIFQFFIGIVSSGTKKYALLLRALEIPLSLLGWALVSLATFIPIMTQNPDQVARGDTGIKGWESTVKQILFALLICALIFVAEKTLVQLISVSYHRKQYETRIKESKHHIYLLGQLYEASRSLFPEYCTEFEDEDAIISDSILRAGQKSKNHQRSDSAAPLRLIRHVGQNVGRFGDKVTAAFGNVAHEITGKQILNPTAAHSVVINALEKRRSSEALARRIWMSFAVEGKDGLYEEDIVEVLGAGRESEAEECFHFLDRDGNGDISMEEMILTVAEFGRVRKSINRSMHDVDQAINVLDTLLLTVAMIIMVLVFVSFVTTGAGTVIAAAATSLLSLSFVFATTAQEVLGSCIFLFVKHPFDVGDRVEIATQELFVEEISLLYTVFRTVAEQRITQVANVVLNTTWIDNVTRSKAMRERIKLTVDFGTTFADVQLLKAEMERFVRDKENSRDFQQDVDIEVIGVGNMDKLELRIEIRHKSNWSNETVRAARRSKFMCALVLAVRKVPIYGPGGGVAALGDPSNPSYSVSITDDLAKVHRDEAAEGKEKKRLVPTSQMHEVSSTMAFNDVGRSTSVNNPASTVIFRRPTSKEKAEESLIGALNSRPAGYDTARPEESDQLYRAPSATSGPSHDQLSIPHGHEGDRTALLREPSKGRRKGPTSPTYPTSTVGVSPTVAGAGESSSSLSHLATTDRYEIPSYYSAAIATGGTPATAGTGNPYEYNNPFGLPYPGPSSSSPSPPTYQPSPSAAPPSRRPVPQGNAFAQQQQHQQIYGVQPVPAPTAPNASVADAEEDDENGPHQI